MTTEKPLPPGGRKFDGGKVRYGLVPPFAQQDYAKVLTAGSIKYEDDNWRIVPDAKKRYIDALLRHIEKYRMGHLFDDEEDGTGLPHMAHIMCCAAFVLELDRIEYDEEALKVHMDKIKHFYEKATNENQ